MTHDEQIEYTRQFLAKLDHNSEIKTATDKGIAIGTEKGIAIGREEGREEEREKSYLEKLESARKFKQCGLPLDVIAQNLGLPLCEVESL